LARVPLPEFGALMAGHAAKVLAAAQACQDRQSLLEHGLAAMQQLPVQGVRQRRKGLDPAIGQFDGRCQQQAASDGVLQQRLSGRDRHALL
jgi:hypothetical protein